MPAEATIRDVARQAKVSVATVSRVLNNSTAVREITRQRVLDAITELNYVPNPIARRLSLGRTHTIAVVLPLFTLPSFVERLRGVQQELASSEYDLVLYSVESPEQRDEYFSKLASPSRVDGLLLISLPPSDQDAERMARSGVPTVLVDAFHPELSRVIVDDEQGGYRATRHLLDLGHRKIAFLSDYLETPFQQSMRQRYNGYRIALQEAGIPFRKAYHVWDTHGRPEAREMAKSLLSLPDPPTAIFASSDTQAIGVMDAARELNVNIPEELSVIGYDGIRDAEYVNLTTMCQPLFESGVIGAEILLGFLQQDRQMNALQERILPIELVVRKTTAPPAN